MASTYSTNLRLELIGTGEQQGTWGATTNVNLGTLLEEAIGGYATITVSDSGDTTLTTNNGSADQSRNMVLNLTGTISAARNVICPAIEKLYVVKNATTGGYAVTIKVSGQTGVSVPNGSTVFVYVDGTDVRAITGSAALQSIGTSGATVPLLNGTNTWSSSQTFSAATNTFGSGSGLAQVFINGGAGSERGVVYRTNGLYRWSAATTATAESGANAGSNYAIARFDDASNYIDIPFQITRSTGVTTIKELALTTSLAIAQGGTGATSNSAARTNLGLEIGTNVQAYDATLQSLSGLGTAANRFAYTTGVDTWAESAITAAGRAILDDADATAQRATLGLGGLATLSAVGTTEITDLSVTTGKLADLSVVTGKIAPLSVGTGKLIDLSVTEAKIADGAVTAVKLASGVGFPSGTKMLFQQTAAPTGWTKDTTHNNKALRVVSGTAGSGGSVDFTTAFANQTVSGTTSTVTAGGTVGNTTLSISQMPLHGHPFRASYIFQNSAASNTVGGFMTGSATGTYGPYTGTPSDSQGQQIGGEGGGTAHTHSFTGTGHSHTFSGSVNLAVQYVDLIIATKD